MPVSLVREAKAVAARRGATVAAVVAEALERMLGPVAAPKRGVAAGSTASAMDADVRWFERNRLRLARRYRGRYVAVVGRRIIDHDPNFDTLARRVFRRLGAHDVYMPRVDEAPPVVHLRSPRLASS